MDVVGFGALNLDRLYCVRRMPVPGEHQPITEVYECPGGSAANTVAWLADLDFKTGFLGAVGRDAEGQKMLADFEKRGVDTSLIQKLDCRSGLVIGFVDSKGERTLCPYPGANNHLKLSEESIQYASNSKIVHLTSFVSERQLDEQKKLVSGLSKNVRITFAPGDLYASKGMGKLKPILKKTFVLFLNEEETLKLTKLEYKKGSSKLNKLGVEVVVVTLGDRGCYISSSKEKISVKCKKIKPVDTTGAGDSFTAGFLAGLLSGKKLEECGKQGNQLAAKCIKTHGARK
ncbi:MAG: carbohydrate kinase family protein [Candidatus Altiarchaeales archaeon]|nr:carbohydrate kinase family protein [Candidatus Altiarchaeales archaeon]